MPIKPVTGSFILPADTAADVELLLEHVRTIEDIQSPSARETRARALTDHFAYLAGTRPALFRPHQEEVAAMSAAQLDAIGVSFSDLTQLMEGASDACAAALGRRVEEAPDRFFPLWMLGAIGSPASLDALAAVARKAGQVGECALVGIGVPDSGPAVWRFSRQRYAARKITGEKPAGPHPVGLPVTDVLGPDARAITWHYASIDPVAIDLGVGLPRGLHLLGPRAFCEWSAVFRVDAAGRYAELELITDPEEASDPDLAEMLREVEAADADKGGLELRPYDADLTYTNGHIQLTAHVVGTVGGPPMGIYESPTCPSCARLMFHVMTLEHHVRSYGDGFRSLYVCEDCQTATTTGSSWN